MRVTVGTVFANLALLSIAASAFYLSSQVPPIRFIDARIKEPFVTLDSIATVVVTARVFEQCPSEINGFWKNEQNGVVVHRFPTVTGGYTEANSEIRDITVRRPVPATTDEGERLPGRICYVASIRHSCGLIPVNSTTPPACVSVRQ